MNQEPNPDLFVRLIKVFNEVYNYIKWNLKYFLRRIRKLMQSLMVILYRLISQREVEEMNRRLNRDVQTVFLMTGLRWIFTSSSIIKEAASFGGDIESMVPKIVYQRLKEKFRTVV